MEAPQVISREAALLRLAQLEQDEKRLQAAVQKLAAEDPFWAFRAWNKSDITAERLAFVQKWIKPEDIRAVWDTQEDAFRSAAPILILLGGNQGGKTTTNAVKAHIKITGEVPESLKGIFPQVELPKNGKPVFGRVYSPSNATIEEVLVPKFLELMPRKYWHRDGWERTYSKQEKILRYYRDGKKFVGQIKFMSYEQDVSKTQGASLSFIHFDEEPPYDFYKEALPRFTTAERLDIEFFLTPTGGMSWLKDVLVDQADGVNVQVLRVPSVFNPYASLTNLEQMMKDQETYEERKMRLLGEIVSLSGLIYKGDSAIIPNVHIIEPFELDWHRHIVYRGLDVHLSKPSCCVEVAVDPAGIVYVVGVYNEEASTKKVKEALAQRAIARNYRLGWTRFDKSLDYGIEVLDGVNIMDLLKQPPNPIPAMFPSDKHHGSIHAGVDRIKEYIRPRLVNGEPRPRLYFFRTPEVMTLVKDIQTLERDRAQNEEKRGQRDKILEGKKDRHAALRYVFQGQLEWVAPDDDAPTRSDEEEDRYI